MTSKLLLFNQSWLRRVGI